MNSDDNSMRQGKESVQSKQGNRSARGRKAAWVVTGVFLAGVAVTGFLVHPLDGRRLFNAMGQGPAVEHEQVNMVARDVGTMRKVEPIPTEIAAVEPTPTPEPAPHPERGDVIAIGVETEVVRDIQIQLMHLEYLDFDELEEGFSEGISDAVAQFQQRNNLPVTGDVDEATFAAMEDPEALAYAIVEGMSGEEVLLICERLVELGYMDGVPNDVFDETVAAAVSCFRERNKLTPSAEIDTEAFELLLGEETISNFLGEGDKSPEVEEYQNKLYALGYLAAAPDGVYGRITAAAVRRLQEGGELEADGYLNRETVELLTNGKPDAFKFDKGLEGDDVKHMQERLAKLGYLENSQTTGNYGDKTALAMLAFQSKNGLKKTGEADAKTLAKLNSEKAKPAVEAKSSTPAKSTPSTKSKDTSTKSNGSTTSGDTSGDSGTPVANDGDSSGGNTVKPGGTTIDYGEGIEAFIEIAASKKGSKYVRGAKGPNSFDCSGFVYWCLNQAGVKQKYMTSIGWRTCSNYERLGSMSELKRGDVLVFSGSSSGKGHVGIYIGGGKMIDASSSNGRVVERSTETKYWKSHFLMAYRIW